MTKFSSTLLAELAKVNPDALLADGFEDAIIGYTSGFKTIAVYSRNRCLDILMRRDGVTFEEADEFFSFNVEGAYVGEFTPIFVETPYF